MKALLRWIRAFRRQYVGTVYGTSIYTDRDGQQEHHYWVLTENGFGERSYTLCHEKHSFEGIVARSHARHSAVLRWVAGGPLPPLEVEQTSDSRPSAKLIAFKGGKDSA